MRLGMILFPREERFFELLKQAVENVLKATEILEEVAGDVRLTPEKATEVNHLEHEGDRITREIIGLLNVSLVTPIDREDITDLAQAIDDVLDITDGLIERMVLYKLETSPGHFKVMAQQLHSATSELVQAITLLNKPKKYSELDHHCDQVIYYEKRADRVYREAIAELFEEERDLVKLIKWREIYAIVEDAVDATEDVCDILQGITVKGG